MVRINSSFINSLRKSAVIIAVIYAFLCDACLIVRAQENSSNSVKVSRQDIVSKAFYHGEIDHLQNRKITSLVSGDISQVNINVGDKVTKDDVLIQFDLNTIERQINQLNLQIEQLTHWEVNSFPAEKEALKAQKILLEKELSFEENSKKSTVTALKKAFAEQIASINEVKEAEDNLSSTLSKIQLKRAEQKIKEAQLENQRINNKITTSQLLRDKEKLIRTKEKFIVKAPFDGTIIAINDNLNSSHSSQVEVREFLLTIVNQDSKVLNVTIPESEVYKLINEKNNTCYIPRNNVKTGCHLNSISISKTPQGIEQYIASYELLENSKSVTIGETAEIHINKILKKDALTVPVNSLIKKESITGVMLLNEDEEIFTPVILGVSNNNYVEIISGLHVGQEISLP